MIQSWGLTQLKSVTKCVACCRCICTATKLHFADFDPHIVARYLTTTVDVRPNLITVCLPVSLISTGLLANTPVFIYVTNLLITIIPPSNIPLA